MEEEEHKRSKDSLQLPVPMDDRRHQDEARRYSEVRQLHLHPISASLTTSGVWGGQAMFADTFVSVAREVDAQIRARFGGQLPSSAFDAKALGRSWDYGACIEWINDDAADATHRTARRLPWKSLRLSALKTYESSDFSNKVKYHLDVHWTPSWVCVSLPALAFLSWPTGLLADGDSIARVLEIATSRDQLPDKWKYAAFSNNDGVRGFEMSMHF